MHVVSGSTHANASGGTDTDTDTMKMNSSAPSARFNRSTVRFVPIMAMAIILVALQIDQCPNAVRIIGGVDAFSTEAPLATRTCAGSSRKVPNGERSADNHFKAHKSKRSITPFVRSKACVARSATMTSAGSGPADSVSRDSSSIETYEHDGWKLTYRYRKASPGYESQRPLLLIHPIGIGLSSWFWKRMMDGWVGPALYAPNLIGCGISEGSDAWDPDERGLFFPLSWTKGCEAMMFDVMGGGSPSTDSEGSSANNGKSPSWLSSLTSSASAAFRTTKSRNKSFVVVAQGGLAPVGIQLAHRNPDLVHQLILTSPPQWNDLTTPVPPNELQRNFDFLKNPIWGNLAFQLLESRGALEFFSNAFLFSKPCDADWLDELDAEACKAARPPVMAFNAGFCLHRSYEEELVNMKQHLTIFAGNDDKRPRPEYQERIEGCTMKYIEGQNVMPWESPTQLGEALMRTIEAHK